MKQIFLHGLGQTADSWKQVLSQLDSDGNRFCPDLSNLVSGQEVTYHNLYASFSSLCEGMNEPLVLCGLSLGGVLALNYAVEHPERVKRLILIAAQYRMPKKLLRLQNLIFRFMPNAMFHQMGFGKQDFLRLCSTMAELDFSQQLHRISCPVLLICGKKDKANKAASIELSGHLPNSTLKMLDSTGHEVNLEASKELASLIRLFVDPSTCSRPQQHL